MNYNLTFPVVVLKDENDSVPYMAYIPYFDVMTQGYDEEELQMMIKDLLNLCLEDKESYTIQVGHIIISMKMMSKNEVGNILRNLMTVMIHIFKRILHSMVV